MKPTDEREPREFWAYRHKHFGGKWHLFSTLVEVEAKIETTAKASTERGYELFKVREVLPGEDEVLLAILRDKATK